MIDRKRNCGTFSESGLSLRSVGSGCSSEAEFQSAVSKEGGIFLHIQDDVILKYHR